MFSLRFILILSTHLRPCFPSGLLPTKTLYVFLFSPVLATVSYSSHPTWFDQPNDIHRGVKILKLLIIEIFFRLLLLSCSFVQTFSSAPCSQTPSVCVHRLILDTMFHSGTKKQAKLQFIYFHPYVLNTAEIFRTESSKHSRNLIFSY
jgi:hypothetical protein